jgi:anaerobic selenocysteine-containing dehydrogenase
MKWKWKRITWMTAGTLVLMAGAALAATSGYPVDGTFTSFTNFLGTDVANGLFWGGATTVAAHCTLGAEFGRIAHYGVGGTAGGSILTNANGIATVAGISPGATIHLLNHPVVHAIARHIAG